MSTKEMQFNFDSAGMNLSTKQIFKLVPGKEPTVTVIPGQINKISIGVTVTHTDAAGADPPAGFTRPPLNLQKGWPFKTLYGFTWDVEVDGEEISILGHPKESVSITRAREGVTTQFKVDGGKKYLEIQVKTTYETKGLKLDIPYVEGEGDFLGFDGSSMQSEWVKFLCKLEPEKAAKKTWPKIPDGLVTAKAYFEAKNADTLPTQSVKDIEAWVKDIKDFDGGALYRVIRDRQVTIFLDGYTSKSGYKDYNKKLAESRIGAVERIIRKSTNFGSGVDIVPSPKQQSKFEEKNDYRVEVYFDKVKAETAVKASEP